MLKQEKNPIDFDALSKLFALLSNPIRLQILDYLLIECCKRTEGCCSVTDIYTELNLPQPLISKHLKIMKGYGVLSYNRQGSKIMYYFNTTSSIKLIKDFVSRLPANVKECCL